MMTFKIYKLIVILSLSISYTIAIGQQNEPPTITPCGDQHICISDTLYNLCVEITVDSMFSEVIQSFEIYWGDGNITEVPGSNTPENQYHEYNLSDFFNNCTFQTDYTIELITHLQNSPDPLFNASKVWFRNPPEAYIGLPADTVCVNTPIIFTNNSCPQGDIMSEEWNFGDDPNYYPEGTHIYTEPDTYVIELIVTNSCGSDTTTRTIVVLPEPVADIDPISGVLNNSDPYFVCLGGDGQVQITGIESENATIFEWISNDPNLTLTGINDDILNITFHEPGTFDIILEVNNPCDLPDTTSISFEVVDDIQLIINPHGNACTGFLYTPNPDLQENGVIYEINGTTITSFPYPLADNNTYLIEATLNNACGEQYASETIIIAPPAPVEITNPQEESLYVCQDSGPIILSAIPNDGIWGGNDYIIEANGLTYFDPTTPDHYIVTYSKGSGDCESRDSFFIEVIEYIDPILNPHPDTCASFEYVPSPELLEEGVTYHINNNNVTSFPILLDQPVNTIIATLDDACGFRIAEDIVLIAPPVPVDILSPLQDTFICRGSSLIPLTVNISEGEWEGLHIEEIDNKILF